MRPGALASATQFLSPTAGVLGSGITSAMPVSNLAAPYARRQPANWLPDWMLALPHHYMPDLTYGLTSWLNFRPALSLYWIIISGPGFYLFILIVLMLVPIPSHQLLFSESVLFPRRSICSAFLHPVYLHTVVLYPFQY